MSNSSHLKFRLPEAEYQQIKSEESLLADYLDFVQTGLNFDEVEHAFQRDATEARTGSLYHRIGSAFIRNYRLVTEQAKPRRSRATETIYLDSTITPLGAESLADAAEIITVARFTRPGMAAAQQELRGAAIRIAAETIAYHRMARADAQAECSA